MAVWSRLFSGIFGVGVGIAAADAVQPVVEVARQEAWKGNANRVLSPDQLAQLLAQGLVPEGTATDHAERNGYASDKLQALAQLALKAPGVPEALHLWRRGEITQAQFRHALRKASLEPQYDAALELLRDDRLSPEVVALAIVRGLIADPGILPVSPPTADGKVPRFPVFPIEAVQESEDGGFNLTRLSVLAGIAGRPMSPEAAAQAFFRGIIERVDYERAVSESDVRNEWRDAILEVSRFVVSPQDAAGLRLRGWITAQESYALGALHGASPETMDRLYLNRGRPAAPGQMVTAAARGVNGPDGRPMDQAQFEKGITESDIRPEWGPMLWGIRHLYPSLFQLNRLVTSGAVTPELGAEWATKERYAPEVVAALLAYWQKPAAAASTSWTKRAATQLWTRAHREFLAFAIDDAEVEALLTEIGVPDAEHPAILSLWTTERGINRLELTPAQIRKAYKKGLYTEAQALAALEEHAMTPDDAMTFLQSG